MKQLVVFALAAACGSSSRPAPQPISATPASPISIDLLGDANGIWWDAPSSTLYLTDNTHGAIAAWTDAHGFATVATLPPAAKRDLGGLLRLSDGTFVVASFGFGKDGAILHVASDGSVTPVPKADPTRRRIGLALRPDGQMFAAYFLVGDDKSHAGGVETFDFTQGTAEVPTFGLAKAVGVAASATMLYYSDQEHRTIDGFPFSGGPEDGANVAKDLPSADMLVLLPGGDLVTGGRTGTLSRVTPKGAVTQLASGLGQLRGVAYDAAGKRLFVVEHGDKGAASHLRIVPAAP